LVRATTLRGLLQGDGCLTLPGVYDGISARVAASIGFDALYMTGYGVVASALGAADAGTATFTEMLDRVRCIAGATAVQIGTASYWDPCATEKIVDDLQTWCQDRNIARVADLTGGLIVE